jgi:hypothetical protein
MERFSAWLVTGPLGHLAAGVADWVTMLVRWRLQVARERRAARARRPELSD